MRRKMKRTKIDADTLPIGQYVNTKMEPFEEKEPYDEKNPNKWD